MAEETEGQDTGTEGVGAGVDPVATAIALGGASREQADAFLKKQEALIDLQCEYLADKGKFELSHLRWRRFTEQMKGALQLMTAIIGIAFAASLSYMVWGAAHSTGLIIEPFAVPSDMAARGLSGQVVANQMLDKLTLMLDATVSTRPAQSYKNNWGDNLKVEIPETGVSIGELQNFLKDWLGHDTHITGEVWRTQTGIAVTAREGTEAGATFTGPESDLDGLMQKAAEHVYSVTQPFRYANLLDRNYFGSDLADRIAQSTAIYRKLIAGTSKEERAWAWYGLGTVEANVKRDFPSALPYFRKSIVANPSFSLGNNMVGAYEMSAGHHEKSLSALLDAQRLLDRSTVPDINPRHLSLRRLQVYEFIAREKGDYKEEFRNAKIGAAAPEFYPNILTRDNFVPFALQALSTMHDGGGVRAYLLDLGFSSIQKRYSILNAHDLAYSYPLNVAGGLEDWPSVFQIERSTPDRFRQLTYRNYPSTLALVARAHANMSDMKGAERLVANCPADSDDCMIARGQVAEMQGQQGRADYWFARVEKQQPSIPFADAAWGKALLARGKPDDAIAKFTLANQKGPHFADPLEGWGEALMAKSQSHLALAKFKEAEKYAPNWGRLHLKWGEALFYAGKKDEAQKQFALAAGLDLTPSEKSELSKMRGTHG